MIHEPGLEHLIKETQLLLELGVLYLFILPLAKKLLKSVVLLRKIHPELSSLYAKHPVLLGIELNCEIC